jgi:hypothetical protein
MAGQEENRVADMPALLDAHGAMREEIGQLVAQLAGASAFAVAGNAQVVEAIIARVDCLGVEARRLESLVARRIVQLDEETTALLSRLDNASAHRSRRTWRLLLRGFDASTQRQLREQQIAEGLARQLVPTEALMDLLDQHGAFLKAQLPRCEPVLDEALLRLKKLADPARRSGDDAVVELQIEALSLGIDLLQDLLDRIIDMRASTNILRNKLQLDAEERVLSLTGLSGVDAPLPPEPLLRFLPLFQRARQRLLTVAVMTARRKRLNDVFRRRIAGSRQAGAG